MEIRAQVTIVGFASFADGFVTTKTNFFDEVRKNPTAVCARLMNTGEWQLAEWVMDNFVQLPTKSSL